MITVLEILVCLFRVSEFIAIGVLDRPVRYHVIASNALPPLQSSVTPYTENIYLYVIQKTALFMDLIPC